MFFIELVGTGHKVFVSGYSNTLAQASATFMPGAAKAFPTVAEAEAWAKSYLPGYKWQVVPKGV